MLAIKNNLMAENAARHLGQSYDVLAQSVERLSSGLRINSAKDDAAGLAVRELIRADAAALGQGSRNAQDAISMLQTSEGAMQVVDDLLVRMKELAEQASTGSYSSAQRSIMNDEFTQLSNEITRIAESTSFNGITLLAPTLGVGETSASYLIHIASDTTIDVKAKPMDASALGVKVTGGTKETWINSTIGGVAVADNIYVTDAQIDDATPDFKFKFSASGSYADVDLGDYSATGITLNQLVNEINTAWQAAGYSGYVAYADFDSDAKQYKLKIENPDVGDEDFLVDGGASANALFDSSADFSNTVAGSAGSNMNLLTTSAATSALAAVTSGIKAKDVYRASLGYMMNRLEAATSILKIQRENLLAAESRVSDVDVATEVAKMTRNQVLAQAGISMLAQANMMPQMALSLLQ